MSSSKLASTAAALGAVLTLSLAHGHVARAQNAPALDAASAAHIRDAYLDDLDTLHTKILALANAIPASKYTWRPAKGVRSISEALMHVASEWYVFTPMSLGAGAPDDFIPKTTTQAARRDAMAKKLKDMELTTDKAAVLAELDRSWKYCRAQVLAAEPAGLATAYKPWGMPIDKSALVMVDDLHEHLGQLIAYARSVGVTPPWSK